MKNLIYLFIILFTFIGCGGGGSSSKDSSVFDGNFPTDNFSGTAYSMWDYVVPAPSTNSISSKSITSTYSASFRSLDSNTVEETPTNTNGEKVKYTKNSTAINISFYKNNIKTFSYDLKKSVYIGEQTTKEKSACMLVNHFPKLSKNNRIYNDVIEIDCGKHKGFYARGKGEIAQE